MYIAVLNGIINGLAWLVLMAQITLLSAGLISIRDPKLVTALLANTLALNHAGPTASTGLTRSLD